MRRGPSRLEKLGYPAGEPRDESLENGTSALQDFDIEDVKIVWDTLHPIGNQVQVQAQFGRAEPKKQVLHEMCLLSNENVPDASSYLSSAEFHSKVKQGVQLVKDQRLIIGGLWRQIGGTAVKRIWASLSALGSFFRDYQMIMLENDSHDDTKSAIQEVCSQEQRAWCFTLSGLGSNVPLHAGVAGRVKGLTAIRQTLLMKVREFDPAGTFDYVMMVDADIFAEGSGGFDIGGALSAFPLAENSAADAVCAYQVRGRSDGYYDSFSHRGPECQYANFAGQAACPAQSCGGGMVLYKMSALHETMCNYEYVNEDTCEHVPFNFCLASHGRGRIFLYKPWSVAMVAGGQRSYWLCERI